jgi:hypothetical protein
MFLTYQPYRLLPEGAEMSGASLARSWVERELQAGDLRVLSNVAFRRTLRPHSDPVERLGERGFLVKTTRAPRCCRMTLKGWTAILLRHTFAQTTPEQKRLTPESD